MPPRADASPSTSRRCPGRSSRRGVADGRRLRFVHRCRGERLELLRRDPTAWHTFDTGQFSLAGAQAKTALHYDPDSRRWGQPSGAIPTTHILKPAVTGLDEHDLNEHLCLRAAALLGLPAAVSYVERFGSERVIVVKSYDRLRDPDGTVTRITKKTCVKVSAVHPRPSTRTTADQPRSKLSP